MRDEEFLKELKKLGDVRERYQSMLCQESWKGMEIIPVYGFIRDIFNTFLCSIKSLEDSHIAAIKACEKEYSESKASISNTIADEISDKKKNVNAEIENDQYNTEERIKSAQEYLEEMLQHQKKEADDEIEEIDNIDERIQGNYINIPRPEDKDFHFKSNLKTYELRYAEYKNKYLDVMASLSMEKEALKEAYKCRETALKDDNKAQIEQYNAKHKDFIRQIKAEENYEISRLQNQLGETIHHLEESRDQSVKAENLQHEDQKERERKRFLETCQVFLQNEELINSIKKQNACKFDFLKFHVTRTVPGYIDQGYLSCSLEQEMTEKCSTDLLNQVWDLLSGINSSKDKYQIRLPYLKKSKTGIDYFLAMNTRDNVPYIRALVLSILMQYPAGKMNLVMIDPRTSTSFANIVNLGEDDKSLVDTKVWTEESDIQSAIIRFNNKLNETINRYGSAVERCLEKENRNLLAIADFPQGFSRKALEELAIILDNGPKYGVNFVIAQNDEEMKVKEDSPEYASLIEKIKKRMHVFTNEKGRLQYTASDGLYQYILEQEIETTPILKNDIYIINEIYQHLSDNVAEVVTIEEVHRNLVEDDNWLSESSEEGISLPIGIKGLDNQLCLILGRTNQSDHRQHVLIEGSTGSGKSVLLHAIISTALMKYSPQELQLVLLDFKEGVEFKVYADYDLPAVRIVSTESEREFGRNVFKRMLCLHEDRSNLLKQELPDQMVPNIHNYRVKTKKTLPIILFIVDEFETLLGDKHDEIANDILEALGVLVKQGRSSGIHVILSSQSMLLPEGISSQMSIRLALSGAKHVLNSDNKGVSLLKANQAVFNDDAGDRNSNTIFQVMYAVDNLRDTLNKISSLEAGEDYEPFMEIPKKVLYANIEDYTRHPFNQMIIEHMRPSSLTDYPGEYASLAGTSYDFEDAIIIPFRRIPKNHLLVVTRDENIASRVGALIVFSLLYSDYAVENTDDSPFIIIFDFNMTRSSSFNRENIREIIAQEMPERIQYYSKEKAVKENIPFEGMNQALDTLYQEFKNRKSGQPYKKPMFLIIFGLEGTRVFETGNSIFENDIDADPIPPNGKLKDLMKMGSQQGIHIIAFAKDYALCRDIYNQSFEKMFQYRIVTQITGELLPLLVGVSSDTRINGDSAIYCDNLYDIHKYFRVLECPKVPWIQSFSESLRSL